MQAATKVVFNTVILYVKILVSMAIALVSVPLVLRALGVSDYGLYNLIVGVIAMLAFLNNSLTISSQRYMSVAMGAGDYKKIELIYNTSFYMHFLLGIIVIGIFEIGSFFIGSLNIEPDRVWCAMIIYQFLIINTFLKIVSVPFDALINAHEDMGVFAVIETIDSVLMLLVALVLKFIPFDKLIFYGFAMLMIAVLTMLMKYLWVRHSYKQVHINLKKYRNSLKSKEMFGFAGWNLTGNMALIGRNQGVAIIINLFLGTTVNAAYGIAHHINGALGHFSSTFQKAINPQLMKSEGMNNRERLIKISFISSKFSVLALSLFAVPLIIEMPDVLKIWLKENIPPYTMELSRYILLLAITYQYSVGIMSAIQAVGNIRNYQITMSCIVLLNLPLAYFIIKFGYPVYYVTIGYVVLEMISLLVRIMMAKRLVNISPSAFCLEVIGTTLAIILISSILSMIPHTLIENVWLRLLSTGAVYCSAFVIMTWCLAFDNDQRHNIMSKLKFRKVKAK